MFAGRAKRIKNNIDVGFGTIWLARNLHWVRLYHHTELHQDLNDSAGLENMAITNP